VLQAALGEVLALGDVARVTASLDHGAVDAPPAEVDGQRQADGSAAHDHDLMALHRASARYASAGT
jgi:hypothetical protein